MELIYTARLTGFDEGRYYRNPEYFVRPDPQASSVILDGEWPVVRDAYEALSIPVSALDQPVPDDHAAGSDDHDHLIPHSGQDDQSGEGNGKGHVEIADDREGLAAQYEQLFGQKPGNMKTETIAAKIAERQVQNPVEGGNADGGEV